MKRRRDEQQRDGSYAVEVKLFIVLCYYVVLSISVVVAFSVLLINDAALFGELQVYFTCEAAGNYPGKEECDHSRIDSLASPILLNIASYMYTAFPTVTLVYVISWRDIRTLIGKIFTSLANKTHKNTVNTEVN